MTILQGSLIGFSLWMLAVLTFTVGVHRWSRIFVGTSGIHEFPPDAPFGPDWYKRATRAHANCVENLPVYGAIVCIASLVGAKGAAFDVLGLTVLFARIGQTTTHIGFTQTERTVSIRFAFFFLQVIAKTALIVLLLQRA